MKFATYLRGGLALVFAPGCLTPIDETEQPPLRVVDDPTPEAACVSESYDVVFIVDYSIAMNPQIDVVSAATSLYVLQFDGVGDSRFSMISMSSYGWPREPAPRGAAPFFFSYLR